MKQTNIDHHIKADVLIIGGGFSGLWAAISAREHVENVVLVDKGPADWGGLGTASGGDRWKARGTNWIALTSDCGSMFAQYRKILEENR